MSMVNGDGEVLNAAQRVDSGGRGACELTANVEVVPGAGDPVDVQPGDGWKSAVSAVRQVGLFGCGGRGVLHKCAFRCQCKSASA